MPLEKEEQVRLQARKRLEEQLKQYRVKRQQERVSLLSLEPANGKNSRQSVIILGSAVYFFAGMGLCVSLQRSSFHVVPTLEEISWGSGSPPLGPSFPPNRHVLCLNLPLEKQRQRTCGCNRS